MPRTTLSDDARTALSMAVADETSVRLTMQLQPSTYREVNKALTRIAGGGQWNRRQGLHLFPRDPRPELAALVGSAAMPVDPKQAAGWFRTPDVIADEAAEHLDGLDDRAMILEPSAGDGSLVRAARQVLPDAWIDAVEPDEHRYQQLAAQELATETYQCSFEEYATTIEEGLYDAAILNPPFASDADKTLWVAHLELAWTAVRPGGRLVAIVPASLAYRSTKAITALRERIEATGSWRELPVDAFKESGTQTATLLVTATVR
jgi:hypothetical protein